MWKSDFKQIHSFNKKKLQKTLILKNGSKNCWKKVVKKFKEDYC